MEVKYVDFSLQYTNEKDQILSSLDRVLSSGQYILGNEVEKFENNFSALCGTKYAIGVANGTDALILIMRALGIGEGDQVITAPNSWISSASSIALVRARPVFVDVRKDQNIDPSQIERAITSKTKAILPVHLTGRCANMDPIFKIAEKYDLCIIEDAAQSVNARYKGKISGSMGICGSFSLHPLKNLNAAGDAGIITTDNTELAEKLCLLRNHGLKSRNEVLFWGYNSRLDALQASILNFRLNKISEITKKRRRFAKLYREKLKDIVYCPEDDEGCFDVYHLFVIQTPERDRLQEYLSDNGIQTGIHYPTPIHLQPCAEYLGYKIGDFPNVEKQSQQILSLPIHNGLNDDDVEYVADKIIKFFNSNRIIDV